jgi:hypothetical protein
MHTRVAASPTGVNYEIVSHAGQSMENFRGSAKIGLAAKCYFIISSKMCQHSALGALTSIKPVRLPQYE